MGEVAAAVGCDADHILDTAAVLSGDIDSGLNRDYLSCLQTIACGSSLRKSGGFVDIESHAVTEAVTEASLVACAVDNVASNSIDASLVGTLADSVKGGELCLKDGVIKLLHIVICFTDDDGTGHIRAVALDLCAVVHCEEALLQLDVSRHAVWH